MPIVGEFPLASASDQFEREQSESLCNAVINEFAGRIKQSQRGPDGKRHVFLALRVREEGEVYQILQHGYRRFGSDALYLSRLPTQEEVDQICAKAKAAGWHVDYAYTTLIGLSHWLEPASTDSLEVAKTPPIKDVAY